MKSSKRQHNIHAEEPPKKVKYKGVWADTYIDTHSMKENAISLPGIERLAHDLLTWARTDDAYALMEFLEQKGISPQTFSRWLSKYEALKLAHETAKEILGLRREKNVTIGKWKDTMIKNVQGHYSQVWRDEQARQTHLEQAVISKIPDILYLEKMPKTDEVPERED